MLQGNKNKTYRGRCDRLSVSIAFLLFKTTNNISTNASLKKIIILTFLLLRDVSYDGNLRSLSRLFSFFSHHFTG